MTHLRSPEVLPAHWSLELGILGFLSSSSQPSPHPFHFLLGSQPKPQLTSQDPLVETEAQVDRDGPRPILQG